MTYDDVCTMIKNGDFVNKTEAPNIDLYNKNITTEKVDDIIKQYKMKCYSETYMLFNRFHECVVNAIMEDINLPHDRAEIIYTKAYEYGHSEGMVGMLNIVSKAQELCKFIKELI